MEALSVATALGLLHEIGDTFEIRILKAGSAGTISGYFDDPAAADAAIAKYDGKVPGVYFTLNPVNPALMARASNRLKERATSTTTDVDAVRRRWLLIDVDATRPAGISATDAEVKAAAGVASRVKPYLEKECGWPAGAIVHSGNGVHLLYRVDLPNDNESRDLLKRVLLALAEKFNADGVAIDTTVFNAARIAKVPGTLACKGDSLPERPHRRSKVVKWPDGIQVVDVAALTTVGGMPAAADFGGNGNGSSGAFDVEVFMRGNGLAVRRHKPENGGDLWELEVCPFNSEHDSGEAFISRAPGGALLAGCHHNSCTWRWDDLREKYQPGHKEFVRQQAEALAKQAVKDAALAPVIDESKTGPPPEEDADQPPKKETRLTLVAHTVAELRERQPEIINWVCYPYIAEGDVVSFESPPKDGKTTFVLGLVHAIAVGGRFLGEKVQGGPVLYCTEERVGTFLGALDRTGNTDGVHVILLHECAWNMKWPDTVVQIGRIATELGSRLVAIDTLSKWAGLTGDDEFSAGVAMATMTPLQHLASTGLGVAVIRHERKAGGAVGQAGRGSTAWTGEMDTVIAVRRIAGEKTRRMIAAIGRHDDTPEERIVDFASNEYQMLGDPSDLRKLEEEKQIIDSLNYGETGALPINELRGDVSRRTAERILGRLLREGVVKRGQIAGARGSHPYGYWLSVSDD